MTVVKHEIYLTGISGRMINLSADFLAILEYGRLEYPTELFYENLRTFKNFGFMKDWIERSRIKYPNSDWGNKWYVRDEESYIEIGGMGGIVFLLTNKCCLVSHYISWGHFVMEGDAEDIQNNLRSLIREIAANIGTNQAIYIPDSSYKASKVQDLFYDDKEYHLLKSWLLSNCGEPTVRISDIYDVSSNRINTNGYIVDFF
ncbi:hypothetical protein [Paenibacillus kobensis]|uniref:hypothetical protein n=1 Tax=Paenibacillus kobensis TaxID=59841 RepID=UPI000FDB836D|nr:hypothetical protein [Paenibacillus kobensis]